MRSRRMVAMALTTTKPGLSEIISKVTCTPCLACIFSMPVRVIMANCDDTKTSSVDKPLATNNAFKWSRRACSIYLSWSLFGMFKRSDPHSAQCPVDVLCVDVSQMWQKYFIGTFCNLATSISNSMIRAARSADEPMAARHALPRPPMRRQCVRMQVQTAHQMNPL